MTKSEILRQRKSAMTVAGKMEYMFFTTAFLAAICLCALNLLAADSFMKLPQVRAAYAEIFSNSVESLSHSVSKSAEFSASAASAVYTAAMQILEKLPIAVTALLTLIFAVFPVYQGTVRWSAYIVEEGKSLSPAAVFFYFTSPRLYFSSVLLTLRIFLRKISSALLFFLLPFLSLVISCVLSSDYFTNTGAASAALVLSAFSFLPSLALWIIFCQRFGAVRYLFALGKRKKLFRASAEFTREKRTWLFTLSLRLAPNLILALPVVTAPVAFSRIIFARSLAVKEIIRESVKKRHESAVRCKKTHINA